MTKSLTTTWRFLDHTFDSGLTVAVFSVFWLPVMRTQPNREGTR